MQKQRVYFNSIILEKSDKHLKKYKRDIAKRNTHKKKKMVPLIGTD